MEIEKAKAIIEAMLFAAGRPVAILDIVSILEMNIEDVQKILESMQAEYISQDRGIELIKLENSYQLATKKEFYEYIYPLFDNRNKPNLSNAALETLSIIAYNPRITRAEIEQLRGVSSDASIYKLLEYSLIEDAGKSEAPGRPMTYKTTNEFLRLFGLSSLEELPELPKYKLDENEQLVIDEMEEKEESGAEEHEKAQEENTADLKEEETTQLEEVSNTEEVVIEAPSPVNSKEESEE